MANLRMVIGSIASLVWAQRAFKCRRTPLPTLQKDLRERSDVAIKVHILS